MPTDTILISTGVCIMFLLFAFVLAWADHSTSQWIRGKAEAKQIARPAHEPSRRAA